MSQTDFSGPVNVTGPLGTTQPPYTQQDANWRMEHIAAVPLAAVDTGGGLFSWLNPTGVAIVITRVILDVSTVATGACTADVGTTATNGTTLSDNMLDGVDVHTAAGAFSTADGADANGKWAQRLAAGKWVTGSKASGASAGLVGTAYIFFMRE